LQDLSSDLDERQSSIDGFESPHHLNHKLSRQDVRTVKDEISDMEAWDFDISTTRQVGLIFPDGSAQFASPYWRVASKRALVDGLVSMHSKMASIPEVVPLACECCGETDHLLENCPLSISLLDHIEDECFTST
jgi:hypothetical protein